METTCTTPKCSWASGQATTSTDSSLQIRCYYSFWRRSRLPKPWRNPLKLTPTSHCKGGVSGTSRSTSWLPASPVSACSTASCSLVHTHDADRCDRRSRMVPPNQHMRRRRAGQSRRHGCCCMHGASSFVCEDGVALGRRGGGGSHWQLVDLV